MLRTLSCSGKESPRIGSHRLKGFGAACGPIWARECPRMAWQSHGWKTGIPGPARIVVVIRGIATPSVGLNSYLIRGWKSGFRRKKHWSCNRLRPARQFSQFWHSWADSF